MPFGKELSHMIEEQISKTVENKTSGTGSGSLVRRSGVDEGRLAQLEANLQRFTEKFTEFLSNQKKGKRTLVEYGLNVVALEGMRLAVTAGRATFVDRDDPVEVAYTFLQMAAAGSERQFRYIYVNSDGVVLESTTDPTNIGTGYLPLAIIDVWANTSEIDQNKIQDIRPRAGAEDSDTAANNQVLTGNATIYSPDTGNDSFIVAATNPASMKVNISAGRALVAGEILNAEGGILDLASHRNVVKELIAMSDGVQKKYDLYHQAVTSPVIYVNDVQTAATVDAANGSVTFSSAPPAGSIIRASYSFSGNYMLVFLVEKAHTNEGTSFGVIGWTLGSNRSSLQPPVLSANQHAIAKVDMSGSITAITDAAIDNSYEIKNLTQEDLQRGGQLTGGSLAVGSITGDHITAQAITGQNIAIEAITGPHIALEAIAGQHIAVETIQGVHIAPQTISGDRIVTNAITSDKIAGNTISAGHLTANAVTSDKIAANSITSGKIAANTVTAAHVVAGQITGDKLAVNSVTSDKVAANTITGGHIVAGQITGDKIAANAITSDKVAANSITSGHILASQITGDKLAVNSVTSDKVAANAITAGQIAANAITAAKIAAGTITGDKVAAGTITGDRIVAGGIEAANIKTGAVNASHIAAGAITTAKLAANAVTADNIAAKAITADKLAANAVTAEKLGVTELSAITAKIGTLRTATTGARTEIKDNLIEVYDANNILRVRMGVW